jgi:hypothetical protein
LKLRFLSLQKNRRFLIWLTLFRTIWFIIKASYLLWYFIIERWHKNNSKYPLTRTILTTSWYPWASILQTVFTSTTKRERQNKTLWNLVNFSLSKFLMSRRLMAKSKNLILKEKSWSSFHKLLTRKLTTQSKSWTKGSKSSKN